MSTLDWTIGIPFMKNAKDSFEGKPGKWDPGTINLIISWANQMVQIKP